MSSLLKLRWYLSLSKLLGAIVTGAKAVGYVVANGAAVVAKSKALSAAVGAGLGATVVVASTPSQDPDNLELQ